jgi:hypothetical protein
MPQAFTPSDRLALIDRLYREVMRTIRTNPQSNYYLGIYLYDGRASTMTNRAMPFP